MHIPDGYLSPSTCATFYAAAAPFWYIALQRVKKVLHTRAIPLLSVFAALCFVIMMFNLPLPGGTTGHAVGMGIASIVLGPWVSMVAISVALAIQALFFGDGGVTAFGANSFNMAIVGSLVASGVYRFIAGRAEIESTRRVVAAGLAGYAAINVAALCAAVEFGIQPLLFHTASGAPLYAPYPLSVSIPAMLIGHLTFAGLAELVISAGVVAYLQRTDPQLLRLTAPSAPLTPELPAKATVRPFWPGSKKLWLGLALALILTPLGVLAVGSAWGEWSAKDFSDSAVRNKIVAASRDHSLPQHVPTGLQHLSSIWKAPVAGYEPAFIRSLYFGYFVSAAIGAGLVILLTLLLTYLLSRTQTTARRNGFIEKTMHGLLRTIQEALLAEDTAQSRGLLQTLDARVKLAGIGALIIGTIAVHRLWALLVLFAAAILLAVLSRVSLRFLAARIWISVLAFTGLIALPAVFLVAGQTVLRIPLLEWPVTAQGLTSAAFLILRAETAATLSLLLVLCTPWNHLLRALRFFRVSAVVVVIVQMTYRYIFLLLRTAQDMFESRQMRLVGYLRPLEQRRLAAGTIGVLLDKTLQLSNDVHSAMLARGFRDDVRLLDDLQMTLSDWLQLNAFAAIACLTMWFGR